ncbi:MAG: polysaccharide pyruvyl transferase family protein [Candidatus Delongbacteria bacterium]|nr:polysaccharide pyruvyl transferase family protein [Candidatus Delongbacteria bacterium]MBN2835371.1 polysaccharide pyruvyl transferase family protein [Candidatus Delongbacteria bacterium]
MFKFFGNKKKNKEIYERPKDHRNFVIHHYCPHTFNAGDHFVILSIRKHLSKYIENAVFIPKAIAKNRGWGEPVGLKGENIELSNRYSDAVIIGGSDQYNNWSPKIKAEEITNLTVPLFLIGLGVSSNDLNNKPYIKEERYYNDILQTNQKAAKSSVRDKTTEDFLKSLGYNDSVITGCPALFLFNEELHVDEKKRYVALTFPYPLIRKNSGMNKYNKLIESINKLIQLLKKLDLEPIISCHDDRDVIPAESLFPNERIFFSNYPHDYFEFYKKAKFVVGSRLHATIFSSGLGIPTVNINLDLRGQGFSETFGLNNWNLNYDIESLDEKLEERIIKIDDKDLSGFNDFVKIREMYKDKFNGFMKECAEIIIKNKR